jgi:hypothetical protein
MQPSRLIVSSVLLVALLMMTATCRTSRFPTCETDAQCAEKDEGATKRYCVNVRCVECRTDGDCKPGHVCNRRMDACEKL